MGARKALAGLMLASSIAAAPALALAASGGALPPGLSARAAPDGLVLFDAEGRPLWRLDLDHYAERRKEAAALIAARCAEVCARLWRPAPVPHGFTPAGDWGLLNRPGGAPQLTYRGAPLYSFAGKDLAEAADAPVTPSYVSSYAGKPSALHDGVPAGTVYWHAALYQPPPPKVITPAGVAVRWAKTAYVFADSGGRTLYASRTGAPPPADPGYTPLAAPMAARPLGAWRPATQKDGARIWSYRGRLVYRSTEAEPLPGLVALEIR